MLRLAIIGIYEARTDMVEHRAEFSAATRKIIAERAGYQCSVLNCGRLTVGPGPGRTQVTRIGMAAHIYAAAPGGPRGTGGLSVSERSQPENGIWCCYIHGKAIDSDTGNAFPAAQLKAWKRLHEARKSTEVYGNPLDHYGLVESIAVNSAPASLGGRKFELGMRNIITGPNASGKSVLARLIASVAYPDHVAELSQVRDVDIEVRWFDPQTHDVATTGRAGNVSHVLDGRPVPYVARPYKTILLSGMRMRDPGNLIELAQLFDLSASAMRATLNMLPESSNFINEAHVTNTRIDWVLDVNRRTVRSSQSPLAPSQASLILLELAAIHARYHARTEPTFLLLDEFLNYQDSKTQILALERLKETVEHAQVAVISHSPALPAEASRDWTVTTLENHRLDRGSHPFGPIDFEIETTTTPPTRDASREQGDQLVV